MSPSAAASTSTSPSSKRVRRLAGFTHTLATGASAARDQWALQTRRSPRGVRTQLLITTSDGLVCPPIAVASLPLQLGRVLTVFGGRDQHGPAWLVVRVSPQVDAVRVQLSDGTTYDLDLVSADDRSLARVAVLVYPRRLDVHRIDPYDTGGRCLDEVR